MNLSLKRISQLGGVVTGKTPSTSRQEFFGGEYQFVTPSDLEYDHYYCRTTERTVTEEAKSALPNQFIPADAVMFTCIGATIGKCGIAPADCLTNQQINSVVANESTDSKFLYYLLCHNVEVMRGLGGGSATPIVSKSRFEQVELLVPPLRDQQAIAATLSAYDDLIENNHRRMALLEDAARQIYREWFVRLRFPGHEQIRITNGVPEAWENATAYSVMEVLSGGTPKTTVPDYWDGEIQFYTPKDASDTTYVLQTERAITELGLKNCNSRLYEVNTVFISARGTVGKLNLASRPMAMNQSCYALIGKGHVSQLFLFCALKEAIEHFKQHAVGAVFDAIVVDTFKLIPFMVPDEKRVRLFEEVVGPIFRQVANLMEQHEKLRAARDLLLPRLMSGKIAV